MRDDVDADVLIIGGGPAGIAAAVALRKRGVAKVTVLEREPAAGGVPRHCGHPPFGMHEFGRIHTGPAYARRLVELAQGHGVRIATGTTVTRLGKNGQLDIVDTQGRAAACGKRVILATGVRETPRAARLVSGDRPLGVVNTGALQAFVYLRHLLPFKRPLIVGTELVALSAILTCLKAGIRPVGIVEEGARPTAPKVLALFPRLVGIPMYLGTTIEAIQGGQRVESVKLRLPDGSIRETACDGILFTGQFTPEAALVRGSALLLDEGTGGPQVDQFGRCSDPAYFAAGNVLRPVETAGWSFREGRRIGHAVADDLAGRLPNATTFARIERQDGIKLVMPQRLLLPMPHQGLKHIQVRVTRHMRGMLVLSADGRTLWKKRLDMLPERRLLIPLEQLNIPDETEIVSIGVASEA